MVIFMSTHTLGLAEEIADRIGIVDRGQLRFLGTLAELRGQVAQEHTSLERMYLDLTATAEDEAVRESGSRRRAADDERANSEFSYGKFSLQRFHCAGRRLAFGAARSPSVLAIARAHCQSGSSANVRQRTVAAVAGGFT